MKTRTQKATELSLLKEKLPKATIRIFTTFARDGEKGLSVAEMQQLKRALRKIGAEFLIAKKSLVDIASRDLNYDGVDVFGMNGSVGIALAEGDQYAVAREIYKFAKEHEALKLYSAWGDGYITPELLAEMATMPSREELVVRLLGMLQYPIRSLAMVLQQIADKQPAAPAPAPVAEPAAPVVEEAAPAPDVSAEAPAETPAEAPAVSETPAAE
ncbi:MAG: 50S ribosomal protein L10 [Candidatus Paceibacterota bacterium]|nr:MAG: 50S ribosomal protein L10 [Candidatus Paceibacterota bacterium]